PDGSTLLVLTSGFNRNFDPKGRILLDQSTEYVFVYDVRQPIPAKRQVLKVLNSYAGLAWAPDGKRFFVSGGSNDNVHVFEQSNGQWVHSVEPLALGHRRGLGVPSLHDGEVVSISPVAAGIAVNASGTRLLVANYYN